MVNDAAGNDFVSLPICRENARRKKSFCMS